MKTLSQDWVPCLLRVQNPTLISIPWVIFLFLHHLRSKMRNFCFVNSLKNDSKPLKSQSKLPYSKLFSTENMSRADWTALFIINFQLRLRLSGWFLCFCTFSDHIGETFVLGDCRKNNSKSVESRPKVAELSTLEEILQKELGFQLWLSCV